MYILLSQLCQECLSDFGRVKSYDGIKFAVYCLKYAVPLLGTTYRELALVPWP